VAAKPTFTDYYELLGISREAETEEIRQAYRKLAFDLHPDRNPDNPAAQERFLELVKAYNILIDPNKRASYNLRYDKLHGLRPNTPSTHGSSLEMARRKRASRYNRSGYSQRMRYRGATSRQTQEPRPQRERRTQSAHTSSYAFSEAHAERIIEEERSANLGYRSYSLMVRVIAGLVLLFCLGMILDKQLASPTAPEVVKSQREVPWSFSMPHVVRYYSTLSTFAIKDRYENLLKPGMQVELVKSPIGKIPVEVRFKLGRYTQRCEVYGALYSGVFSLVWILVAFCLATMFFRRNPEFSAYFGTFTLILCFVIMGIIFG